jgi:acetate kinase
MPGAYRWQKPAAPTSSHRRDAQRKPDAGQFLENAASFAPLHNPAHLIGIAEALKSFPNLKDKNVAVFDTAFHQTMPEESYLYALPYKLYKEHGVRRYGAHGTSHFYVTQEAAKVLNKPVEEVNIITCHLGNGGSVSAIRNGKCVDTSMDIYQEKLRVWEAPPQVTEPVQRLVGMLHRYQNALTDS